MVDVLDRRTIQRIVQAVVTAETARLRPEGALAVPSRPWPGDLAIGEGGLELDSLERMGALSAVADAFQLEVVWLDRRSPSMVDDWIDWAVQGVNRTGTLGVLTSGSTGSPRLCRHRLADLLDEAGLFAEGQRDRRRVVALVPAHHLYGLVWTALLPASLGIPVVDMTVGAMLALEPGDLVIAVPEQWKAISRLIRRVPAEVVGVSSGAPLDEDLATALTTSGINAIVDVYGSSETSAIAARRYPNENVHTLLPRWTLLEGETDLRDVHGARWPLPDRVERVGPRSLRPVGRSDGAVQIGGVNVWPDRVASVLRSTHGVADVAVRLGREGRLKAFIASSAPDADALRHRLATLARERLSEAERPTSYAFGSALPRNAMGKLADWA